MATIVSEAIFQALGYRSIPMFPVFAEDSEAARNFEEDTLRVISLHPTLEAAEAAEDQHRARGVSTAMAWHQQFRLGMDHFHSGGCAIHFA